MAADRRRFLQTLAVGAALPLVSSLGGCGGKDDVAAEAPAETRIPLAMLPDGGRLNVELGGIAVELSRRGDEITARSLICTHQGCEVAWVDADRQYVCPCHEGRFDDMGRPVYGSPRAPLELFEAEVIDGEVVVRG